MKILPLLFLFVFFAFAQEKHSPPHFQKETETLYRLGEILLDKEKRSLSFPALINQREDLIEYALVSPLGATHESPLVTDTSIYQLTLGFLLLKYPFFDFSAPFSPQNLPDFTLKISVSWEENGEKKEYPLEKLFKNIQNPQTEGSWVLRKLPESSRYSSNLFSVFWDSNTLVQYVSKDVENDEIWYCEPLLPKLGAKVRIHISPASP